MDFKGFKKASCDKNCTILKHEAGHTLKIAHKALSPKMREALEKLPMADGGGVDPDIDSSSFAGPQQAQAAPKKQGLLAKGGKVRGYDDGGDVDDFATNDESVTPTSETTSTPSFGGDPAAAAIASGGKGSGGGGGGAAGLLAMMKKGGKVRKYAEGDEVAPPTADSPQGSAPQDTSLQLPPTEINAPNPGATQNFPQPQQPQPNNDFDKEDKAWQQDLLNQHITPETYHDLFAKKDTLGKIGTIFGLLVGGAGGGLSHQPNAALQMMDKQIQNDLEAQRSSKTNAHNFLKLEQSNQLNNAMIKNYGVQNIHTLAEVDQLVKQGDLTEAQADSLKAQTNLTTLDAAQQRAGRVAQQEIWNKVQKMPEGPQKVKAMQAFSLMSNGIDAKYQNMNANMAAKMQYFQNAMQPTAGGNEEQDFQQRDQMLRLGGQDKIAEDMENKHFPGLAGKASTALTPQDREELNSGMSFQRQLEDFQKWTAAHSGDLNPKDMQEGIAKAADLQGAYRQATHGGVYKEGEQNFISKLIDSNPTKFFNNIRVLPQLKAIAEDNKVRVDQKAKSLGFGGYGAQAQKQGPQQEVRYDKQGNAWVKGPNGKPVRAP
jgi:hypothetical protein